ncbi:MAG: thioredoxin [Chloroflexi bacterium]|nr:thioredoxin [Chloroflexota bacterium]
MVAELKHLTDTTFKIEVLDAPAPVLVDFTAVWCGPCQMIAPIVEQIAKDYDGKMTVAKLDIDENVETTMKYGVMGVPTLMLFKDGEPVERLVGYMPKDRIAAKIKPHLEN